MASNNIPAWPPLSASASGEGDDVVVGSDETSSTSGPPPFIAPGEANLKEVCEQMSQELGASKAPDDGKAGTFAAAAKKSKKLYPYTVFIVAGENEDRPLIHRHYTAFEEFIFQKRIKLTFEENENLKIEWMSFHGSYGVAVCGDKPTENWVKNCAQIFKFEERSTRAYFPWQRAESVLYGIVLKCSMFRQKHFKANWTLGQIFKANNLVDEWKHISWDVKRNSQGIYLECQPIGVELLKKLYGM